MCSLHFLNKTQIIFERERERECEAHFMDGMSQVGIPIAAEEVW